MNHTHDKTREAAISKIMEDSGAFFAFSNSQFKEKAQEGVTYARLPLGMLAPKDKARATMKAINEAIAESIAESLRNNTLEEIIRYELANHEAPYSGNICDTMAALAGYDVTESQVQKILNTMHAE